MTRIISFKHPIWVSVRTDGADGKPSFALITGCLADRLKTTAHSKDDRDKDTIVLTITSLLETPIAHPIDVTVRRDNISGFQENHAG